MALKETNGTFNGLTGDLYHQIYNVTGLQFGNNSYAEIRKHIYSSEQYRIDNPESPISITNENFHISKESADQIKAILYAELKAKAIKTGEDEDGVELFDKPYDNMIDC